MAAELKTTTFIAVVAALALGACDSQPAATDGAGLFKKKCGTCHSTEPGAHKVGPSLAGVIGRQAGSTDFPKYKALAGADFTWDEATIDEWITDPKKFIGKPTAMTVKVKDAQDRAAIIEYLKSGR